MQPPQLMDYLCCNDITICAFSIRNLKLIDQLLFRPDNTFHYLLLDIGNKFEKNGNKTANSKRKTKDEIRNLTSLRP